MPDIVSHPIFLPQGSTPTDLSDAASRLNDLLSNNGSCDRLTLLRRFLVDERDRIREAHRQGTSGRETTTWLTQMVDAIIQCIYACAAPDPSEVCRGCAVVALGGYGRCDMSPRSDIDLLFLYTSKGACEVMIREVLHTLYDLGFAVGHSVRTVRQSAYQARRDSESKTAMLDARYVAGNPDLFHRLQRVISRQVSNRRASIFVREKLDEMRMRHVKNGMTVHLLEPNVKESPGGLRDVQTVQWIMKAKKRGDDLSTLVESRMLSKRDAHLYETAIEFLRRTRHELHFQTDRKHDVLEHEIQPKIASALGYRDGTMGLGVEEFMRDYYLHARHIRHISDLLCRRLCGSDSPRHRWRDLFLRRDLSDGIIVVKGEVHLPRRHKDFFSSDPTRLLRVFLHAQQYGAGLHEALQWEIKEHLSLIDEGFRRSPVVRDLFFAILRGGRRVAVTFRLMHELGVLGAYIPEFGRLTCLVQYDLYHIFTADEHSLVAIENVERLRTLTQRAPGQEPTHLERVMAEVPRHDLLYLAIMLHDIGKAERKNHVPLGVRIARGVLERWDMSSPHRDLILFLIEHHLVMAEMSQRRDLDDEAMIAEFARRFPSLDALRMLYLLTYADCSALSQTAWNDWKAFLLRDLYDKAFEVVTLGERKLAERRRADEAVHAVVELLGPKQGAQKVYTHLVGLPPRYPLVTGADTIERHLRLIDALSDSIAAVDFSSQEAYSEIVVCTFDKPYRLSEICGVFAVNNVSVLGAQVYTRDDGIVLDTFSVIDVHEGPQVSPEKQRKIRDLLVSVFEGSQDVADLVNRHSPPWSRRKSLTSRPTRVIFENAVSERFTIIDVFTQDSIGLLYRMTRALSDLGLEINTAKVSTQVDQIADSFYVFEREGGKVTDPERLEQIRETLIERIG